jgi:hypothetical protein
MTMTTHHNITVAVEIKALHSDAARQKFLDALVAYRDTVQQKQVCDTLHKYCDVLILLFKKSRFHDGVFSVLGVHLTQCTKQ